MIATPPRHSTPEPDTIHAESARPALTVESYGLTDPGRKRPSNEDQFLIARLNKSLDIQQTSLPVSAHRTCKEDAYLFVVADGMGGEAAGEVASSMAVGALEAYMVDTFKWFLNPDGREGMELASELRQALEQTDARLVARGQDDPALRGMGTTLTMGILHGHELLVAHVGDSRGYLVREGRSYRLTHDHTVSQEMVRRGVLSPEEAAVHPAHHVLTNVVGGHTAGVRVELVKVEVAPGDRVVLCSDGLSDHVPDDDVTAVVGGRGAPRSACEELVRLANERGGRDNITVIVVRLGE
jgi:protein phosphatase